MTTDRDRVLSAVDELEKCFFYAEQGNVFSEYGIKVYKGAFKQIRTALSTPCAECERLRNFVSKQAEDEGLWFIAQTASEGYLQQELMKLHVAIESTIPSKGNEK